MDINEKKDSFYSIIIDALKNINSDNGIILVPILFLIYVLFFIESKEIEEFFNFSHPDEIEIITPEQDTIILDTHDFSIIEYKQYKRNISNNDTNEEDIF